MTFTRGLTFTSKLAEVKLYIATCLSLLVITVCYENINTLYVSVGISFK